jgi:hypothetical protein
MSLIKSNSALVAFSRDESLFSNNKFNFLHLVQSISLDVSTSRINLKQIGSSTSLTDQFVNPEIKLDISFLNTKEFFNELVFGLDVASKSTESIFKYIINGYYTKDCFILFNNTEGNDLLYSQPNNLMKYILLGDLYLTSYSISYKLNSLPVVSAGFACNKMSLKQVNSLNSTYYVKNNLNVDNELNNLMFDVLSSNTMNAERLVYVMDGITLDNEILSNEIPLVEASSFLAGIIQSFDISINLNRNKFYFFEQSNHPNDRKTILPINGSLKIDGISYTQRVENLEDFFYREKTFKMTVTILDKVKNIATQILIENIIIESFSYSLNINGFLEYSLNCSFQIDNSSGFKILYFGEPLSVFKKIQSSDSLDLETADGYLLFSSTGF